MEISGSASDVRVSLPSLEKNNYRTWFIKV